MILNRLTFRFLSERHKRRFCLTVFNRLLKKASYAVIARSISDEAISYLLEILNYASLARPLK